MTKQLVSDSDSSTTPVKERRTRGRPPIYKTDDEKAKARAEKRRIYNARYYRKRLTEDNL